VRYGIKIEKEPITFVTTVNTSVRPRVSLPTKQEKEHADTWYCTVRHCGFHLNHMKSRLT